MNIECIENRSALPDLKMSWDRLADIQKCPLLGYDWFESCISAIHQNDKIKIYVLRDESGSVLAIAPLVQIKRHGMPHLITSGSNSLYEPGGVLYSNEKHLHHLLNGIVSTGMPATLYRLFMTDSMRHEEKSIKIASRAVVKQKTGFPSLYIDLPDSMEIFLDRVSSRRKYDYRRAKKRSMDAGKLSFECITPTPDNAEEILMSAYEVESSGWKGKNGSGILYKKPLLSFFTTYGKKSSAEGLLKIFFLRIDSQIISSQIAVQSHNKLWILKIGYDEKWSKHSPGVQLTMECIRYAIENKLSSYEFLGSAEDWVRIWADRHRDYRTLSIYPYTRLGLSTLTIDTASHVASLAVCRAKAISVHARNFIA